MEVTILGIRLDRPDLADHPDIRLEVDLPAIRRLDIPAKVEMRRPIPTTASRVSLRVVASLAAAASSSFITATSNLTAYSAPPPAYNAPPHPSHSSRPPAGKKYILGPDGVMRLNPEHGKQNRPVSDSGVPLKPPANEGTALAIISNPTQIMEVNEQLESYQMPPMSMAPSSMAVLEEVQDDAFPVAVEHGEWIDALGEKFAAYEIPMGFMKKLLELRRFDRLEFLIDDSGSMTLDTDVRHPRENRYLRRWEEARDRLKTMMTFLAYIPTPPIVVCFLNRCERIDRARHQSETAEAFAASMYQRIDEIFARGPSGATPFYEKIHQSLQQPGKVARYFFGDGEPTGGQAAIQAITQMVVNRRDPANNPITFLSCSNMDENVEWMKDLEEVAPYCSEFDDFDDESREIVGDQGRGFPYSEGMHLVGQLVAAFNPHDLDALDESVPLTMKALYNLLGANYGQNAYHYYFTEFIAAQRQRQSSGYSPADQLKRNTDWGRLQSAFMEAERADLIPEVRAYKAQLRDLTMRGGGSTVGQSAVHGHGHGMPTMGQSGMQGLPGMSWLKRHF